MNDLLHILVDPAHWIAEFVMDGAFSLILYVPARWLLRRHDHNKHNV